MRVSLRDVYYDSVGYGMLRREWQARYPAGFLQHLDDAAAQPSPVKLTPEEKTAVYQQQIALFEPDLTSLKP
jgi:hypothetical protein